MKRQHIFAIIANHSSFDALENININDDILHTSLFFVRKTNPEQTKAIRAENLFGKLNFVFF